MVWISRSNFSFLEAKRQRNDSETMNALIGKKMGMTQVFSKEGNCIPVTVIQVEKCVPVLKRTQEGDGYDAVLVAYGTRKSKHTNKPEQGF